MSLPRNILLPSETLAYVTCYSVITLTWPTIDAQNSWSPRNTMIQDFLQLTSNWSHMDWGIPYFFGVCKTFHKPILHPKESPKSRISQTVSVNLSTDDYFGPYWNLKIYPLHNIYIRKDNDFTIHLILFTLCVFCCGLVLVDFAVVIPGDPTGNGTIKRMATKDRDLVDHQSIRTDIINTTEQITRKRCTYVMGFTLSAMSVPDNAYITIRHQCDIHRKLNPGPNDRRING